MMPTASCKTFGGAINAVLCLFPRKFARIGLGDVLSQEILRFPVIGRTALSGQMQNSIRVGVGPT